VLPEDGERGDSEQKEDVDDVHPADRVRTAAA